jgi:hypothetical protein
MRTTGRAIRVLGPVAVGVCLIAGSWTPYCHAASDIPDIDSLVDDSGPLPTDVGGITAMRDLLFTVPSGVMCRSSTLKVMHDLTCSGELPGAPAGTRGVRLPWVYDESSGPAVFFGGPPDEAPFGTAALTPITLPAGHKIVFWTFSATRSLVCGVPTSAELVCVLKADQAAVRGTGPFTNGFVISSPHSRVF